MDTEQITDKQSLADIGISSIIGTRKVQQDTVFGFSGKNGSIGIVCDGMGGLARGEIALLMHGLNVRIMLMYQSF